MSTDPNIASILSALEDLKSEVARLSTNLHSAEARITRIEEATFTPRTTTPSSSQTDGTNDTGPPSLTEAPETPNLGDESSESEPLDRCSAEIGRQLKPVTTALNLVTAQLSRIEKTISIIVPKQTATPEDPTNCPRHASSQTEPSSSPQEDSRSNTPRQEPPSSSPTPSKLRYSFAVPTPQSATPVFGQTSTPRRRIVSLDVGESSFSNYSDENSPFSKLKTSSGCSSSEIPVWGTPIASEKFRGLRPDSNTVFGLSKSTKSNEQQGHMATFEPPRPRPTAILSGNISGIDWNAPW